jgi:co-chaperonin GroES (HSP10)
MCPPSRWAADHDPLAAGRVEDATLTRASLQEIKLDGEEFLIVREDEVLAVVETG